MPIISRTRYRWGGLLRAASVSKLPPEEFESHAKQQIQDKRYTEAGKPCVATDMCEEGRDCRNTRRRLRFALHSHVAEVHQKPGQRDGDAENESDNCGRVEATCVPVRPILFIETRLIELRAAEHDVVSNQY